MAAAAILNFTENWIMGHSNPYMVNVCPLTKFDSNILIGDRVMAEKQNSIWRLPPSWLFNESYFGTMANMKQHTRFGANRSRHSCLYAYFQDDFHVGVTIVKSFCIYLQISSKSDHPRRSYEWRHIHYAKWRPRDIAILLSISYFAISFFKNVAVYLQTKFR